MDPAQQRALRRGAAQAPARRRGAELAPDLIDWSRPWLAPYRERGEPLSLAVSGRGVVAALNAVDARFVPDGELPAGEGYEAFIARTGRVPTRENLHDFLNGLVWLHWPALKLQLNAQHQAGMRETQAGRRGPLRDAATLFDENGALLQAPPALIDALQARDWRRVFVTLRPLWQDARLDLVGHALLEKLTEPRKPICAHVLPWDGRSLPPLIGKPFLPLPVLGVPGWWAANEDPAFYEDRVVFR